MRDSIPKLVPPLPHFLAPAPPYPKFVAVGPWNHGEFAALRETLDPSACWRTLPTLEAAVADIGATDLPPELLLLAQLRSTAETEQASIEQLRRLSPLTRVIVVAGSWCEGELRTGWPLTGVVRLYWYEFASWWRAARDRVAVGGMPLWSEPLDDIRAGQISRRFRPPNMPKTSSDLKGNVLAIDSLDHAAYESLADLLSPFGGECVWQPRHRQELLFGEPTLGIFDGGQLEPGELEHLRSFAVRLNKTQAPIALLLDFPRKEHLALAQEAGAAAIIAKPYQADLLLRELLELALTVPAPRLETAST